MSDASNPGPSDGSDEADREQPAGTAPSTTQSGDDDVSDGDLADDQGSIGDTDLGSDLADNQDEVDDLVLGSGAQQGGDIEGFGTSHGEDRDRRNRPGGQYQ